MKLQRVLTDSISSIFLMYSGPMYKWFHKLTSSHVYHCVPKFISTLQCGSLFHYDNQKSELVTVISWIISLIAILSLY